jgi:hypothetical protein
MKSKVKKSQIITYRSYEVISKFYKGKATSKGIPYINHIDEGVSHLINLAVPDDVVEAFILHPFVQCVNLIGTYGETLLTEKELEKHINIFELKPEIAYELLLYRKFANSYLCRPDTDDLEFAKCYGKVMTLVNHQSTVRMLIADKLQNYKDFWLYRKDNHKRSVHLVNYFETWLSILETMVDSEAIKTYIQEERNFIWQLKTKGLV